MCFGNQAQFAYFVSTRTVPTFGKQGTVLCFSSANTPACAVQDLIWEVQYVSVSHALYWHTT